MNVTYPGPLEAITVADGQTVKPGQTIEVDDELGAHLVDEQGWTTPKKSGTPKKGTPETPASEGTPDTPQEG